MILHLTILVRDIHHSRQSLIVIPNAALSKVRPRHTPVRGYPISQLIALMGKWLGLAGAEESNGGVSGCFRTILGKKYSLSPLHHPSEPSLYLLPFCAFWIHLSFVRTSGHQIFWGYTKQGMRRRR